MNSEKFSQALEKVSDELLVDALNVYKRKENRRNLWIRVTAVAATVAILLTALLWPGKTADGEPITAPGILKVYAYDITNGNDLEEMKRYEITNDTSVSVNDKHLPIWSPYLGIVTMIPYTLQVDNQYYPDMEITFDVSVNCGRFFLNRGTMNLGSKFTVDNGTVIHWDGGAIWEVKEAVAADGDIFADIIIRADGSIVGYGVIEMKYEEDETLCHPEKCFAVCFPMINGKFQNISEEYVHQQLMEYKTRSDAGGESDGLEC